MNIDEMSDQEKSAVLAQIANIKGLFVRHVPAKYSTSSDRSYDIDDHPAYDIVSYRTERGHVLIDVDLYDPDNMSLAWRVLNWAAETWADGNWINWAMYEPYFLLDKPPDVAQRAWLDKILELAIEAGMVDDE